MSGSASRTISPSSFSRTRSTPCVLGCWGPMLSSIHSASGSCSGPKASWVTRVSTPATDGIRLQSVKFLVAEDDRLPEGDVVLAQREPFPGFRHQDAAQVGVAVEADAEQISGLTFVPVGGGPDRGQAGDMRIRHRGGGLDSNPGLVCQGADFPHHGESWIARRPIDRCRIKEIVEALVFLEVTGQVNHRARFDDNTEVAAEVRAFLQGLFETTADPLHQRIGGPHTHPAGLPLTTTARRSGRALDQRLTAALALALDDDI